MESPGTVRRAVFIRTDRLGETLLNLPAIAALDAATGKELWRKPQQGGVGARGMNYWESADRKDRRLLFLAGGHLTAISANTTVPARAMLIFVFISKQL